MQEAIRAYLNLLNYSTPFTDTLSLFCIFTLRDLCCIWSSAHPQKEGDSHCNINGALVRDIICMSFGGIDKKKYMHLRFRCCHYIHLALARNFSQGTMALPSMTSTTLWHLLLNGLWSILDGRPGVFDINQTRQNSISIRLG
jgi:hypothetical protein